MNNFANYTQIILGLENIDNKINNLVNSIFKY